MSLIKAVELNSGYDGKIISENISFELAAGKIICIIGPNGAGKSTILKTISGYLDKISGDIYIQNKKSDTLSGADRAKAIAVMLTERRDVEYMTVFDVVSLGRYQYTDIAGRLRERDLQIINNALQITDSFEYKEREFNTLSDGQKQRVILARAIAQEPSILILDEPTSFLDIGYKLEFMEILKKLSREEGMGILMSIHELELAKAIADQVICINKDGRIDRYDTAEKIFNEEYLRQLFNIKSESFRSIYHFE